MTEHVLDRALRDLFAGGSRTAPIGTVERAVALAAAIPQRRPRLSRLDRRAWPPIGRSVSDPAIHRAARILAVAVLLVLLGGIIAVGARLLDRPPNATLETGARLDGIATYPVATLWPDGRVLIKGRESSAYLFDPANGTTTAAPLGLSNGGPSVHVLPDGRILLITAGAPSTVDGGRVSFFDPVSGEVSIVGELPPSVFQESQLVLHDGRVLISGGVVFPKPVFPCSPTVCDGLVTPAPTSHAGEGERATVTMFDPSTGAVTQLAPLRYGRFQHAMLELDDGRVLVVGGTVYTGGPYSEVLQIEAYDIDAGTSKVVGILPPGGYPSGPAPVQLADGRILIFGGGIVEEPCGSPAPQTDRPANQPSIHAVYRQYTHVFDPNTETLKGGPVLPHFTRDPSIVALPDGRAVMFGGYTATPAGCASPDNPYTKAWLGVIDVDANRVYESYNPLTGLSSLPIDAPRLYAASVLLPDGRVALIGDVSESPEKNPIDLITVGP